MTAPLSSEQFAEIPQRVERVKFLGIPGITRVELDGADDLDALRRLIGEDVPALLSEVERLRAELNGVRTDERLRCVKELRSHAKTRMNLAVAEVAAGKDGAFACVSFAATLDKASSLLESGELSAPPSEAQELVPASSGSPS